MKVESRSNTTLGWPFTSVCGRLTVQVVMFTYPPSSWLPGTCLPVPRSMPRAGRQPAFRVERGPSQAAIPHR
jgi:hypothetical protein